MNLLHIDSSPFVFGSVSRELSAEVASAWQRRYPNGTVTYRDLGISPPAHLSAETMNALRGGVNGVLSDDAQQEILEIERAIGELMRCDALLIGTPMYNHSVSSHLKAWIDQVAQAGRTFRYTASGPVGLVPDKPVYLVSSRGGIYSDGGGRLHDFQEPYLLSILGLLGLNDVTIIRAEGVSISPAIGNAAIERAREAIDELFPVEFPLFASVA